MKIFIIPFKLIELHIDCFRHKRNDFLTLSYSLRKTKDIHSAKKYKVLFLCIALLSEALSNLKIKKVL